MLWGLFAAPRRRYDWPAATVATKLLVFGGASVGLIVVGHVALGVILGVLIILNNAALALMGRD